LPFCSSTTWSCDSFASGAVTVTSNGVVNPTNFAGLSIAIEGPGMRPATK
jgi:hypothetical protein